MDKLEIRHIVELRDNSNKIQCVYEYFDIIPRTGTLLRVYPKKTVELFHLWEFMTPLTAVEDFYILDTATNEEIYNTALYNVTFDFALPLDFVQDYRARHNGRTPVGVWIYPNKYYLGQFMAHNKAREIVRAFLLGFIAADKKTKIRKEVKNHVKENK